MEAEERQVKRSTFSAACDIVKANFEVTGFREISQRIGKGNMFVFNVQRQKSTPGDHEAQNLYNEFPIDTVFDILNETFNISRNQPGRKIPIDVRIQRAEAHLSSQERKVRKLRSKCEEMEKYIPDCPEDFSI